MVKSAHDAPVMATIDFDLSSSSEDEDSQPLQNSKPETELEREKAPVVLLSPPLLEDSSGDDTRLSVSPPMDGEALIVSVTAAAITCDTIMSWSQLALVSAEDTAFAEEERHAKERFYCSLVESVQKWGGDVALLRGFDIKVKRRATRGDQSSQYDAYYYSATGTKFDSIRKVQ